MKQICNAENSISTSLFLNYFIEKKSFKYCITTISNKAVYTFFIHFVKNALKQ